MNLPYTQVTAVLPRELVEEIYRHFRGGCLYVPYRKSLNRIRRDLEIIALRRQGKTITELSERYMITRRAVRYILQKAEVKSAALQETQTVETQSGHTAASDG